MARDPILPWRKLFAKSFDAKRVVADIEGIYDLARWNSTAKLHTLARRVVRWMRGRGFTKARVIEVPADGRTAFGGWIMPLAWSPKSATLEIISPKTQGRTLADYQRRPHQLMMFSGPTPKRGITADLVPVASPPTRGQLARLKGQIALVDTYPTIPLTRRLMQAGARGVVTDHVIRIPGVKEGAYLDDAVQYHNFSLPPWQVPKQERGFGFALTPAQGREVRALLAAGERVRVRACVDVAIGPGTIPVITGLIAGRTRQEILFTGHIDEPGANDNASGPALALELGRVLMQENRRRGGGTLERGLRFFFSVEVRGLQALLNLQPELFRAAVLGLDLDMLGCDPKQVRAVLKVAENMPALPDFGYPLMAQCLDALHKRVSAVRWQRGTDTNDNAMGEPRTGAPMMVLEQAPDATYHTDLDTPACLSARAIQRLGTTLGAYVGCMAGAGPKEVRALLDVNYAYARDQIRKTAAALQAEPREDASQRLRYVLAKETKRLEGLLRLVPSGDPIAFEPAVKAGLVKVRSDHVTESVATEQKAAALSARLAKQAKRCADRLTKRRKRSPTSADRWSRRAKTLVPLKLFRGHVAADNLPAEEVKSLARILGAPCHWAAPTWLQWALAMATGKQSLLEIHHALACEGQKVPLARLVKVFEWLAQREQVRWRPFLTDKDVKRALRTVGVKRGMLLMVHSSLSQFGYLGGGPQVLIQALETALGPRGTLCMPTHSYSWLGQPVYDAKKTPSRVGAVTNVFRSQPGVLRSQHPTHSVAAKGPLARALIQGHTRACAPQGREGFWGHFVEQDGSVLMMCPLGSNTLIHAAELWGGVAFPGGVIPVKRRGRFTTEVCPQLPLHTNWFKEVYDRLFQRKDIASAPLGESRIYLMHAHDVIETGLRVIERDPTCSAACGCLWCQYVRKHSPR